MEALHDSLPLAVQNTWRRFERPAKDCQLDVQTDELTLMTETGLDRLHFEGYHSYTSSSNNARVHQRWTARGKRRRKHCLACKDAVAPPPPPTPSPQGDESSEDLPGL